MAEEKDNFIKNQQKVLDIEVPIFQLEQRMEKLEMQFQM